MNIKHQSNDLKGIKEGCAHWVIPSYQG
jgi:hypothetical protein